MTSETGQMSIRSCIVRVVKTLMLWDRWADVDETWRVYSMGPGKKLPGSGILDFAPAPRWGIPNLSRSLSAIPYTAPSSCRHAGSEQRRYAGFYIAKIPAKNLVLENSQHHIGESSPIRRDDPPCAGCLLLYCSQYEADAAAGPRFHLSILSTSRIFMAINSRHLQLITVQQMQKFDCQV